MATKKPAVFETRDGAEFETEAEAERHEALCDAVDGLREAQAKLGKALSATMRTADGELFDPSNRHRYYYVNSYWRGEPRLEEIEFWYDTRFTLDGPDNERIRIIVPGTRWGSHGKEGEREFTVAELYYHKKNAHAAMVKVLDEHIATSTKRRDELAKGKV